MTPGSSTKAGSVPTADFETNQCHLIDINSTHGFVLKNLAVKGTNQGHPYNGLRIGNGSIRNLNNVLIENCFFWGAAPGYSNYPPGETAVIGPNWTTNLTVRNCEIDGRLPWTGVPGCPSPIGFNNSDSPYVENTYVHHVNAGYGMTFWRCSNVHSKNFAVAAIGGSISDGATYGAAINHENVSGYIIHENPILSGGIGTTMRYHVQIMNYDGTHAAANPVQLTGITHDGAYARVAVMPGPQESAPAPQVSKGGVTLAPVGSVPTNGATQYRLSTAW